ncbi:hypothetical protein BB560_000773 [Smittium megazygosporum]|uniref:Uncharacterized protein n=1 Tax=Smittium megazygosporum TaxID=133381 RepID=A0A2T9ZJF1_9FUNG|nr:hypothetical protein BB560_000773 [Smittium megazygosporum]
MHLNSFEETVDSSYSGGRITLYFDTTELESYQDFECNLLETDISIYQYLDSFFSDFELSGIPGSTLATSEKTVPKKSVVWIDIVEPTIAELDFIKSKVGLQPKIQDDLLDFNRNSDKFGFFGYFFYFVILMDNTTKLDPNLYPPDNYTNLIFFFFLKNTLISIRGLSGIFSRDNVIQTIKESSGSSKSYISPEYLCFLLIDPVLREFYSAVNSVQAQLGSLEDSISLTDLPEDFFKKISILSLRTSYLLRRLRSKPPLIKNILKFFKHRLSAKIRANKFLLKRANYLFTTNDQLDDFISYCSDLQNSVYGLRSLFDDTENMVMRCNRFESALSDSLNMYLSSYLLESDTHRLNFVWVFQKWSQINFLLPIPAIIYQWGGTNIYIPYSVASTAAEENMKYNVHYVPFICYSLACFLLPTAVFLWFALSSKKEL